MPIGEFRDIEGLFGEGRKFEGLKEMVFLFGEMGLFGLIGVANLGLREGGKRVVDAATKLMGHRLVEVLSAQGGDMAEVGFLAATITALFYEMLERQSGWKKLAGEVGLVGLAMSFSALRTWDEWLRIGVSSGSPLCNPGELMAWARSCRGDWGDVLAYAVPFIAGGIFYLAKVVSLAGKKLRELKSNFDARGHSGSDGGREDVFGLDGVNNGVKVSN